MTAADNDAVVALLQSASVPLATHTFLTNAPAGVVQTGPYAIVHPSDGTDEQARATGPLFTRHPEYTLHLVGTSGASVQATIDLVKAKCVVGGFAVAPTVSGRRNYNAYWRMPMKIQLDQSVTPWLPYAVIEYGWASDPA